MSDAMLDGLLAGKKIVSKSDNFIDGSGLAVLRKLLYDGAPQFETQTFVAEFQVIDSTPSGEVDGRGVPRHCNPPGSIVGYVQKPNNGTEAAKSGPGNMKMVICALTGMTEAEADTEVEIEVSTIVDGAIAKQKMKRLKWIHMLANLSSKAQTGTGIVVRFQGRRQATRAQKAQKASRDDWYVFARFDPVTQSTTQVEKLAHIVAEGRKVTLADLEPAA